ncbi:MAG: hypothetical protein HC913_00115 [Microscillaceae bacterium]|nr:hypothetical protein [Microscillaceae bacterium]
MKRLLTQAAQDSELVEGTPVVSLLEVKDFRAEYQIEVNTAENNPDRVRNEVLSAVWYMLRREKLHPTAKSNELLLNHPVEKAKELINSVPILQAFTEEEDQLLAENADWLRYGYPERVVKQGETDAALYIVADGAMSVLVKQENGEKIEVAQLAKTPSLAKWPS